MTLQAAKKKLERAGYNVELVKYLKNSQVFDTLRVDTDYYGLYPTAETLAMHNDVRNMLKKSGLHVESHSAKVCIYIY